jgi:hypothetical protein
LFDYFYHDLVELEEFFFEVVLELELSLAVFVECIVEFVFLLYFLVRGLGIVDKTILDFGNSNSNTSHYTSTKNYSNRIYIHYNNQVLSFFVKLELVLGLYPLQ